MTIDDPEYMQRYSKRFCIKEKECTPSTDKVCAYDEWASRLDIFADLCTMYKANCKKGGMYSAIDMIVCTTQKEFLATFNGSMEWVPISTRFPIDDRGRPITQVLREIPTTDENYPFENDEVNPDDVEPSLEVNKGSTPS